MNEKEARQLARDMQADVPQAKVKVYRIGNGEYVVIANSIWLWSHEDWHDDWHEHENQIPQHENGVAQLPR